MDDTEHQTPEEEARAAEALRELFEAQAAKASKARKARAAQELLRAESLRELWEPNVPATRQAGASTGQAMSPKGPGFGPANAPEPELDIPAPAPIPAMPWPASHELTATTELRALWSEYHHLPEVREAFKEALSDGSAAPQEMAAIYAAIAEALTLREGGMRAYLRQGPDPKVLAEIDEALEMFPDNPAVEKKVENILRDGVVTPQELASLRKLVTELKNAEPEAPKPSHAPAKKLIAALAFPMLVMKPPRPKGMERDED